MTDTCGACHERPVTNCYACEDCGDTLAKDLKALIEWLHEDLETTLGGVKGAKSREGSRGGRLLDFGLRVNWNAAEVARRLHRALSEAVDHCQAAKVRHQAPTDTDPPRTIPSMALWLTWRIDGLCLDPLGPRHIAGISSLVERAGSVVSWQPPERRFLGECEICGQGHVYVEEGDPTALCDRCEGAFPAEARHADLVAELDERLLTAAEIGKLSTYLGLHRGRERVTQQIHVWYQRKIIEAKGHNGKAATFRLGDVRHRLAAQDQAAG